MSTNSRRKDGTFLKNNREDYIGKVFPTKCGVDCVIIDYVGWDNITVKFLDEFGMEVKVYHSNLQRGAVRNVYAKTVYGVGCLGEERFSDLSYEVRTKIRKLWQGVLERGHSDRHKEENPSYKDVYVCEEWHNLQNFTEWVIEQEYFDVGYHLDKDILIKGNKVYSPDTCCFVPSQINSLFTDRARDRGDYPIGVYYRKKDSLYIVTLSKEGKQGHVSCHKSLEDAVASYKRVKESQVKAMALKWKSKISNSVFDAMMRWTVE